MSDRARRGLSALLAAGLAAAGLALAAPEDERPRGLVDGSAFANLATEQDEFVRVSLEGPLLRLVAGSMETADPELAAMVRELDSLSAIVVSFGADALPRASESFERLAGRLRQEGWTAIATVRDKDSQTVVLALERGEFLDGLTVLVLDRQGKELVFTNIAGTVRLDRLAELSRRLDLPGLSHVPRVARP